MGIIGGRWRGPQERHQAANGAHAQQDEELKATFERIQEQAGQSPEWKPGQDEAGQ